jgi:hypothetical protein
MLLLLQPLPSALLLLLLWRALPSLLSLLSDCVLLCDLLKMLLLLLLLLLLFLLVNESASCTRSTCKERSTHVALTVSDHHTAGIALLSCAQSSGCMKAGGVVLSHRLHM